MAQTNHTPIPPQTQSETPAQHSARLAATAEANARRFPGCRQYWLDVADFWRDQARFDLSRESDRFMRWQLGGEA